MFIPSFPQKLLPLTVFSGFAGGTTARASLGAVLGNTHSGGHGLSEVWLQCRTVRTLPKVQAPTRKPALSTKALQPGRSPTREPVLSAEQQTAGCSAGVCEQTARRPCTCQPGWTRSQATSAHSCALDHSRCFLLQALKAHSSFLIGPLCCKYGFTFKNKEHQLGKE